jgi:hypothetical protein
MVVGVRCDTVSVVTNPSQIQGQEDIVDTQQEVMLLELTRGCRHAAATLGDIRFQHLLLCYHRSHEDPVSDYSSITLISCSI